MIAGIFCVFGMECRNCFQNAFEIDGSELDVGPFSSFGVSDDVLG